MLQKVNQSIRAFGHSLIFRSNGFNLPPDNKSDTGKVRPCILRRIQQSFSVDPCGTGVFGRGSLLQERGMCRPFIQWHGASFTSDGSLEDHQRSNSRAKVIANLKRFPCSSLMIFCVLPCELQSTTLCSTSKWFGNLPSLRLSSHRVLEFFPADRIHDIPILTLRHDNAQFVLRRAKVVIRLIP